MQHTYSYLHFFSAVLFLALGVFILIRDFRTRLNLACAGVMFSFFIWSSCTVFVHHPFTPEAPARVFANIAAIGWLSFPSFHLWFAWLYARRKSTIFMNILGILNFLVPILLIWNQWTRSVFVADFQRRSYGWFTPWEPTIWPTFYFIYCLGMTLIAFWLIFRRGFKSGNKPIWNQSLILIASGTISLVSGFICNIIFPMFFTEGFPSVGDVTSLIWAAGITYVAIKYNMLNLTPFIAANRIIASMTDLLFLLDTHGKIRSINHAAEQILHCKTDQIINRPFKELLLNDSKQNESLCDTILKTPEFSGEVILSYMNGPPVPVELSLSTITGVGIVCVAHDITLQKQRTTSLKESKKLLESQVSQATDELRQTNARLRAEVNEKNAAVEALKESEERFRIIFESAPDGICLFGLDGVFIDGNKAMLRILGCSKDEVTSCSAIAASFFAEAVSGNRELLLKRSDCSEIPVKIIIHQLVVAEKNINVCVVRDLTKRKKAEQEAEELRIALHHTQKIEAVGLLAGGIAHDFNNLLGGIIGYAELLRKQLHQHYPTESNILSKIIDVSKQAAERTSQLLAFARKGKFTIENINIHEIIEDITSLMRHTIDPGIVITFLPDAQIATVKGDRSQLHSALLNLGVNARDALPNGGTIVFSTMNVQKADVHLTDIPQEQIVEQYLKIMILDNGTGMDETTASRVFEPFFTTKPEGKGTGLSLPSVYGTVKQHGGCITLQSQLGKGTTFTLFLPVFQETLCAAPEVVFRSSTINKQNARILVVDDTLLIREIMIETLSCEGHSVHTCTNGSEAISWFRANHTSCDLVILDYAMPDLNGRECFMALKQIQPSVEVIITSGYALDGEIEKTLEAGARSFLQKPFDIDVFINLVQKHLCKSTDS
jgi:PAS domain S-box-containing protein